MLLYIIKFAPNNPKTAKNTQNKRSEQKARKKNNGKEYEK